MSETTDLGTITIWVQEADGVPFVINTESDMEENFDDFLNEIHGTVMIAGCEYDTAQAWKDVDPIWYRQEFLNYCDGWTELEIPFEIFFSSEGDADQRWVAEQLGVELDEDELS